MNKPTQLIFPFQINHKASFESFFCSTDNLNLLTRLADIVISKNAHELIIHGEQGSGKSFLMQAICNELNSSGKQFAFMPMNKALNMGVEIFQNLASLDAVCIDDLQLILANKNWEMALFNLINECYEKECFLLLSGSINKFEAIPDLVSRIKKMETLRLEAINDDELLEATQAISKNLNIEISDKNMNYLINNSKRDIKTIFRTLSQLEKESLERKKSIGLNLIKEAVSYTHLRAHETDS